MYFNISRISKDSGFEKCVKESDEGDIAIY